MAVFVVIPFNNSGDDPFPELKSRIERRNLQSYDEVGHRTFFVSYNGTTTELSELLGFSPEGGMTGVIMQLGHYYGYGPGSLWEWIDANR